MANPRMYNPNSNMAATLSQFVNPGDTLYKNLAGAGSILSQQINRMTAEEKKQQGILDKTIDNTYRSERADVADEQWGKELSLKERALAIQAANAKRARDKDEADKRSKKLFVDNLDTIGDKYNTVDKEVLDTEKAGEILKPWNAKSVVSPEEQQAYINNEALNYANEEMKANSPTYGKAILDPTQESTWGDRAKYVGGALLKTVAAPGTALEMGTENLVDYLQKSEYDKVKEQVEANNQPPEPAPLTLAGLQKEHVGYLSDSKVDRKVLTPTKMTKDEFSQTFGEELAKKATKTEQESILKSAAERVAPLKAQYDAMPEGPNKEGMMNLIQTVYTQAASENAALVAEQQKYARERETFNYKTMTNAQVDMSIAKYKEDLKNTDPLKQAKAAAELKKILSTAKLNEYKAKKLKDELDAWF